MHTRRNVVAVVTLCSLFTSGWLLPRAAAAEEAREPARPHAEMALGADRIDWQSAGDYEQVVLTIAGPEGLRLHKEFADGQSTSLSLYDQEGNRLPDGAYIYELRLVQRKAGPLSERPSLQAGSFAVRNGSFATPFEAAKTGKEVKSAQEPSIRKITAEEVIPEDTCIGDLCDPGDEGPQILKLKDNLNVGILFEDVFDGFSYFRDWLLQANPNLGSPDSFFLADLDAGTTPFSVFGNSPDYSLVVGSGGKIGIGTATPGAQLHLYSNATSDVFAGMGPDPVSGPALNFGYAGASYGRGAGFFNVRPDASATAPNPSLRFATANVERMILTNTGRVGIGTSSPAEKLHVFENADVGTVLRVENANSGVNAQGSVRAQSDTAVVHFRAHGSGRTISRFGVVLGGWSEIVQDVGNGLAIGTQNSTPIILGTNNTNRLQIDGSTGAVTVSGNLTVNGTFSNPSSRALKEEFKPLDPKTVLDKFARLPIQEWSYKSDALKLRHVGPTVEDFRTSFGLGTEGQHIFPMDVQGVTMTAVQGLYQVVQEKDAEISALRQRLATLEELVSKLAARQ